MWVYASHISGLTLSLNASAYSVAESDGFVNVCVFGLRGKGSTAVSATISTQDISATSLFTLQCLWAFNLSLIESKRHSPPSVPVV